MNLAYVAWKLNARTGSITMAQEVLTGISAAGVPIDVFSSEQCKPPPKAGDSAYSQHNYYSLPRRAQFPRQFNRQGARRLLNWVASRTLDFPKRRHLIRSSKELLIVNGFGSDYVWGFLSGAQPLKSVLIVHDNPVRHRLPGQPPLEMALGSMEKYSNFIFVSSRVRSEWMAATSIAAKGSCAIPNCCREDAVERVLTQDRAEVRHRLGLPPNALVVVCVANIEYLKGQDLLLICLPELRANAPQTLLVLVGPATGVSGGAWGCAFLKDISERKLQGVTAVGLRTDALDYIYAADVLVLPSRCEAMPVSILEAMALGTPVVASDTGGIPELIEHEKGGLLFPVGDAGQLAERLIRLARNSELRRELAASARAKYWANFSRSHLITRYSNAIKKLVRGEAWG